jgi:serine/threonine protein kinase
LFSWPSGIVESPRPGLLLPIYPERFWFATNPMMLQRASEAWSARPKTASWFTASRKALRPRERGDFLALLQVSLLLARAVTRLHQVGLAHSDLSGKNVLIDPLRNRHGHANPGCLVTDIDTLVVPGHFPPDVLGTHPYIAPEVLTTSKLAADDPRRAMPSRQSDRHALALLIYELLLARHPLDGPRILPVETQEEEDFLTFGSEALFIEDPQNDANRPGEVFPTFDRLGRPIADLFRQAFVTGLHAPNRRPLAIQWVQALHETLDLLHPCPNPTCPWKWFPRGEDGSFRCPRCGSTPPGWVPVLRLSHLEGSRRAHANRTLVCFHGRGLYQWHIRSDSDPVSENAPLIQAVVRSDPERSCWTLENRSASEMRIEGEPETFAQGQRADLRDGLRIILGPQNGLVAQVQMCLPSGDGDG